MKKRVTVTLVFLVSVLAAISVYFGFYSREINVRTSATSGSATLTSQVEWEAGTLDNIDSTTTPGSMTLNDKSESTYLLSDLYNTNPENFSTCATSSMSPAFDADLMTAMNAAILEGTCDPDPWIKINLGESKYFGTVYSKSEVIDISYTSNGIDYIPFGQCIDCDDINVVGWNMSSHPSAQNIKIEGAGWRIWEVYFTTNAVATHTTAPTQIDGQEGDENKTLIEWTSFEATDNTPENTSITYEFRVSDDAENWTEWTSNFASLENRRYLQVRATLINTDGVSTPQIDDYTINFHNNQKPNKPTAQTVIIGN